MQRTSQFISQWTGSALVAVLLGAASIAPASAQQQLPPDALPNAPGYELSGNEFGRALACLCPAPTLLFIPLFAPI